MRALISIFKYLGFAGILLLVVWTWSNYNDLPDSAALLSAPMMMKGRSGLVSLAASPYWDHAQAASAQYDNKMRCEYGYLVVPLNIIQSKPTENELAISSVWIHQEGRWSNLLLDDALKEVSANRFDGALAYGCAGNLFKPAVSTDVVVKLEINGHTGYLRAAPAILTEKF